MFKANQLWLVCLDSIIRSKLNSLAVYDINIYKRLAPLHSEFQSTIVLGNPNGKLPGPTQDGSCIGTVSLLVVVPGSTHEENIWSGLVTSNDYSSLYDGPACPPLVFADTVSKTFFC